MRVLSYSGDLHGQPEQARTLRDGPQSTECTVIDLLGVTHLDERFTEALFFLLNRCLKSRTMVVLIATGDVRRRLNGYGVEQIARIVSNRDAGVKLGAALEKLALPGT